MPVKASYEDLTPTSAPSATEGRLYYDSAEKVLKYYDGTSWVAITGKVGYDGFDNNGGGSWVKYIRIPLTTLPSTQGQYKIVIDSTNVSVYRPKGAGTLLSQGAVGGTFWSHVKADGSDIRLFDEAYSQLYFYIEEWDPSTENAVIYVDVPAGTHEVNIAFGNPLATESAYHSEQTFPLMNHFDSNYNGFTIVGDPTVELTTYDGRSVLKVVTNSADDAVFYTTKSFDRTHQFEGYYFASTAQSGLGYMSNGTTSNMYVLRPARLYRLFKVVNGSFTNLADGSVSFVYNTWYFQRLWFEGDTIYGYVENPPNNKSETVSATDSTFSSGYYGVANFVSGTITYYVDYLRVIKIDTTAVFGTPTAMDF